MSDVETQAPMLTAEAVAVMKHQNSQMSNGESHFNESRSRSGSVAGSVSRQNRTFTRTSRRSGGGSSSSFMSAHRRQMSAELTAQAESKFLSLMDLMANASREATSLRESWARIVSEREAFNAEREELLEQMTEVTEELEQNTSQSSQHSEELVQKKKQVETLLADLSIAVANVTLHQKRLVERDTELSRLNDELRLVQESSSRSKIEYERVRSEIETMALTLSTAQADRDGAKDEAARHKKELHKIVREKLEISGRLTEITNNYDNSRKEVISLTDRLKVYDLEREESLQEIERLKEDARKAKTIADEATKDLADVTERYERSQREVHKLRENLRTVHEERDELTHSIDLKNREIKTLTIARDEVQERYGDLTVKFENIKRELLTVRENLRDAELARNEQQTIAERTREHHRLIVIERDEIKDEVVELRRKADETNRQNALLTGNLRKSEATLADMRSELFAYVERTKLIERERDDWRGKHTGVVAELTQIRETLAVVQADLRTANEANVHIRSELERRNEEFEEITETVTTTNSESAQLEFEIESLRTMLREAREQKERAIAARNSSDSERDEFIIKYEEKCRELERFEEQSASYYHANSSSKSGESTTTTKKVSRSSGAASSSSGAVVSSSG